MADKFEELLEIQEDTQKGKYLTFSLGQEDYGIEIKHVTEIIGIQAITPIPEMPDYIKGIINLRGKIIPVMDIRLRFKKEPREYNDRTCIIVVELQDVAMGVIIDSVSEVVAISDQEIVPPPQLKDYHQHYIMGIGKVENRVKLLLDCEKLLSDDEMESLGKIAG